jgi:hypothetical protein
MHKKRYLFSTALTALDKLSICESEMTGFSACSGSGGLLSAVPGRPYQNIIAE